MTASLHSTVDMSEVELLLSTCQNRNVARSPPMMYVRTFLPWIVYGVVPSGSWQWGALAALVVAIASIVVQTRAGRGADAVIIEIGSAVFFAALTVIAFADPD